MIWPVTGIPNFWYQLLCLLLSYHCVESMTKTTYKLKHFIWDLWVQRVLEFMTIIMGNMPSVRDMDATGKEVKRCYLFHRDKAEREIQLKCCGVFYPQSLHTVTYFF